MTSVLLINEYIPNYTFYMWLIFVSNKYAKFLSCLQEYFTMKMLIIKDFLKKNLFFFFKKVLL